MRTLLLLFFLASCGLVTLYGATALPIAPRTEARRVKMPEKAVLKLLFRPKTFRRWVEHGVTENTDIFRNGATESVIGILLVGLNIGMWFYNPFLAILTTLPMAIAGIILGVTGFIKGLRHQSLATYILAAIAVFLNLAIIIAFVALFAGAS